MNKQDLYQQLVGSKTGGGSSNPVNLSSREELYNSLINANKPSASNKVTVKKTIKKPQAVKKEAPKGIVNRLADTVKYGAERFKASFPTLAGGLKVGSGVALDSIGKTITDGAFDERNKKIKIGGKEMTVREAIGKTAPSFIPSADPDPFRRAKIALEKKTGKDLNVTKKLKESGSKDYKRAQEASQKVIQKYGTPEKWTGKWLVGEIGGNAISTIGSVILGVATTAVTKNPVLGLSVGMSNTFMQESGSFYSQAKEEGASEADAQNGAVAVGTINSFIETIPLGRALSKFDSSGNIKKKLLSRISGFILKKVKNSTFEGSTETVQEIVSNAMKKTYKEDTKLFENTPESFAIGFSLGIIGDLTTDPITSNIEVVSPKKVEETNEIIDEALNTPKEERTPEQQQVVDSVNEKLDSMDVSEPQEVVETKVEETKAPADRTDNVTKAPEPAKTIAKAETDPLITEARKYKSAEEFVKAQKRTQDYAPSNTKVLEVDAAERARLEKAAGYEVDSRDANASHIISADGTHYILIDKNLSPEAKAAAKLHELRHAGIAERVKAGQTGLNDVLEIINHVKKNPTQDPTLSKIIKIYEDVGYTNKELAEELVAEGSLSFTNAKNDLAKLKSGDTSLGKRSIDNRKTLYQESGKTKSQLTSIWNQATQSNVMASAQPTKGVDPLLEEARKYKSADEFVKALTGGGDNVYYHGTTKAGADNIDKVGFIKTKGGFNKGRGISVSKEYDVSNEFASGGVFGKSQSKDGDVFKIEVDPKAKIADMQDFLDLRNELKESIGLTSSDIRAERARLGVPELNTADETRLKFRMANDLAYKEFESRGVDIIDASKQAFTVGQEQAESIILNPDVIRSKTRVGNKSQLTDIWNQAQDKQATKPTDRSTTRRKETTAEEKLEEKQDILSPAESKAEKLITKSFQDTQPGLPVGQGKQKDSAFLERVKEQLLSTDPTSYEFDENTGKYNEMNLEENAQRATDFIVSNPKEAIAVSLGLINPPQGVTANAIGLGTMLKARDEKNFNLYRDIATSVTLRSTRLGQEIVSLRGQMNDNSPENFVKRAINARMKNISKSLLKDVEVAGRSLSDTKKEVTKKIDEETVKLKKKLSKDKIKIQKAQDIIDALRC